MMAIAFDTETYLIGLTGKANNRPVPRMVCATFYDGETRIILRGVEAVRRWLGIVKNKNMRIVGHALAFDMLVMARAAWDLLGIDALPDIFAAYETPGRMHDTKIRQQLIDIATVGMYRRGGYDLASLVSYYLDEDIAASKSGPDVWRLRYAELDPYPTKQWPAAAVEYALDDARYTFEVWNAQHGETYANAGGLVASAAGVANADFQTRADFALSLIQSWGLRVDEAFSRDLLAKYEGRSAELKHELERLGIVDADGKRDMSTLKALYARAFREAGLQPVLTPAGEISTSAEARNLLDKVGYSAPWYAASVEYARVNDYITTYMEPLLQATPFASCTRYSSLVATGRTSASGPNIQNFPKRDRDGEAVPSSSVRRCFIPREGNVFIDADWSAAEMRTLAQVNINLGHSPVRMAEALRLGRDLHLAVGAEILGITYEEAEERSADPEVKRARQVAKVANFGFPGGLQPNGFVGYARGFGVEVTPELAQEIYGHWKSQWPELEQFFRYIRNCEYRNEYPLQQHGPHGTTSDWRSRNCDRFTSACNTLFQGLTADGAKLALWQLQRECYADPTSPLFGYRVCAFIHDEFLIEGPYEGRHAAADRLREVMIEGMQIVTPDVPAEVDVDIGYHWGDNDAFD